MKDDSLEYHMRNCDYEIKEQDRYLPIANVTRVMKKALPENAKLSKEAKECVQECASEYISFLTSQAVSKCGVEKRKTLNGEDILWAMFTLGFEHYAETLKIYLAKYRQYEQEEQLKKDSRKRGGCSGSVGKGEYDEGEYDEGEHDEGEYDEDGAFVAPDDYVNFDEFSLDSGQESDY